MLGWLKQRRRRKWIALDFPHEWEALLEGHFHLWNRLTEEHRSELRDFIQVFFREKNWEGCGGLELSSRIRILISVQVGMMVSGFPNFYFDNVQSILVYPDAYRAPDHPLYQTGVVDDYGNARLGEAWWRGPVIVSWKHSLEGAQGISGENLVCHEFAHQLDMLNGQLVDGFPPLESESDQRDWHTSMTAGYQILKQRCRRRIPSSIRCYGAKNPGEFFAVGTESYFAVPDRLRYEYPDVFRVLDRYYGFHCRISS